MPKLCEIFNQYAEAFLEHYADSLSNEQKKAVLDISACRTGILGVSIYKCEKCSSLHPVNNSCGNRHCPGCQNQKTGEWLEKQLKNLLPVDYFFGTFTIPSEPYPFALSHARELDDGVCAGSADAVKTIASHGRFLGGKIGFTGILHTWKRNKDLHPHIHYIFPGGGLTEDHFEWIPPKEEFLVHVKPLMRLYRRNLLEILEKKQLIKAKLKAKLLYKKWNVYLDHAGNGVNTITYLSNYVFRVAITDNNIVALEKDKVTFRFKKSKTNHYVYQTIDVFKFMNLFLLHILPSRFMKIRQFGFLANPHRTENIQRIRELLDDPSCALAIAPKIEKITKQREKSQLRCPQCKGKVKFHQISYISVRFHPLYPLAWEAKYPP